MQHFVLHMDPRVDIWENAISHVHTLVPYPIHRSNFGSYQCICVQPLQGELFQYWYWNMSLRGVAACRGTITIPYFTLSHDLDVWRRPLGFSRWYRVVTLSTWEYGENYWFWHRIRSLGVWWVNGFIRGVTPYSNIISQNHGSHTASVPKGSIFPRKSISSDVIFGAWNDQNTG